MMAATPIDGADRTYTAALIKGQGLVPETSTLLAQWQPGVPVATLASEARDGGLLGRSTEARTRDIVAAFARRYLVDGARPARVLRRLSGTRPEVARQLMFLYTARAYPVLHDAVTEVYWPRYGAGAVQIGLADILALIRDGEARGAIDPPWSETTRRRVASNVLGTLADFGLLAGSSSARRDVRPYRLLPETALVLAYEVHADGFSDSSVLEHPDWALFGLDRDGVAQHLVRLGDDGHLIAQYAGDLLRVSWTHDSLDSALDAIA